MRVRQGRRPLRLPCSRCESRDELRKISDPGHASGIYDAILGGWLLVAVAFVFVRARGLCAIRRPDELLSRGIRAWRMCIPILRQTSYRSSLRFPINCGDHRRGVGDRGAPVRRSRVGFESLDYSVHESRITLRLLLTRAFGRDPGFEQGHADPPYPISDAVALDVALAIHEEVGLSEAEAKSIYDAAATQNGNAPIPFDQLRRDHWVLTVGGRVRVSWDLGTVTGALDTGTAAGIQALVGALHRVRRTQVTEPPPAARAIVTRLLNEPDYRLERPPSPASVAARLWEATITENVSDPLSMWMARWRLLGTPWFGTCQRVRDTVG